MSKRAPSSSTDLDVDITVWDSTMPAGPLLTGAGWLLGLLVWNDNAAAVRVDVFDGTDTTGARLGRLYVPATAHSALNLPRPGWPFDRGITLVANGVYSASALTAKAAR